MPATVSLTAANPYGIALPNAYAVATNIHSNLTVTSGKLDTPTVTVYYAVWATESAYTGGHIPGASQTIIGNLDVSGGSLTAAIDNLMVTGLQSLPFVTSASVINT